MVRCLGNRLLIINELPVDIRALVQCFEITKAIFLRCFKTRILHGGEIVELNLFVRQLIRLLLSGVAQVHGCLTRELILELGEIHYVDLF